MSHEMPHAARRPPDLDACIPGNGPAPFTPPDRSSVEMVSMNPKYRLDELGVGLGNDGWRVLTYQDLVSIEPQPYSETIDREMTIHITANMERYMFSFDGKKFSEHEGPYRFRHNERLRLYLVNHTMMEHPIHLHGMWMQLENGADRPPFKHTVLIKTGREDGDLSAEAPPAPTRGRAATVAIYGEAQTRRVYGEILPVPKARVVETPEGTVLRLAGRELLFLDAPGHARHHVVVRDAQSGHVFAGDTFGLSYRELDQDGKQFSFPTTSPSQFDPVALHRSIDRILSLGPEAVYVAHFGRLTDLTRLARDLHRLIDAHAELGERCRRTGKERKRLLKEGVSDLVLAERERQEWRFPREKVLAVFALDIELNARGLEFWLDAEGE